MIDTGKIKNMLKKSEKLAEIYGCKLNLGFSGGKDSVVLKYFADYHGIDYVANFNNTQIEQYKGINKLRQRVYDKYNGHCSYCGCTIEFDKMQVDHFNAQIFDKTEKGEADNSIDNLMPACRECNNYKYNYSIEQFRGYLEEVYDSLAKTQKMRIAERLNIFERKNRNVKFYFETINN